MVKLIGMKPNPKIVPLGKHRSEHENLRRPLAIWLAGRIGFAAYTAMAERLAWEVSEPNARPPTLVLCEFAPSITIGRLGMRSDIDFSDEELRLQGLEVRYVGRGGGTVLHGPGQVCVAFFSTLEDLGFGRYDVGHFLERFEAGLEDAVRSLRCGSTRDSQGHGIFGRTGLLAAVGITVRRGVVCHGAFVNVQPALELFHRVQTATVASAGGSRTMSSLEADLQRKVRLQDARSALVQHLSEAFAFPRTHIQAGFPLPIRETSLSQTEHISRVG